MAVSFAWFHMYSENAKCFLFMFSQAQSPALQLDPLQQAYAGMQHYTGDWAAASLMHNILINLCRSVSACVKLCFTAAYPTTYGLVSQPFLQQPTLVAQQQPQQQREGDVTSCIKIKKDILVASEIAYCIVGTSFGLMRTLQTVKCM